VLKADLHTHTHYSRDCLISPERYVSRCLELGINCVAVTDHNSIEGALAVQRLAPFKVIVAEEIKTTDGELTGFFLKEAIPRGLTPEETIERVKAQEGLVSLPHPFDRIRREPLRARARERILSRLDVIEVFNSRTSLLRDSERARRLAAELGLPMTAGSDAHCAGELGTAYVEMPDFEGPQEFLEALRQGRIVGQRANPLVHLVSTLAKVRSRLGWRPKTTTGAPA
jgi:predicted metal-dependent phosphoesterase TrpH